MSKLPSDLQKDYYLFPRPRPKGKPVFYVQFRDPASRKRLTARSSGLTNETAAEKWAAAEWARLVEEAARPDMLVRDFVSPFYGEDCPYVRQQRNVKGMAEKTRLLKRGYVERFILKCDWLMEKQLAEVARPDLEAFRDDYLVGERFEGEPCRTSQAVMEVVKTIFGQAVVKGYLRQNPTFRLSTGKYDEAERVALSEKDFDAVLKKSSFPVDRYYLGTMIAATLGCRVGEVRGLQWGDLDPEQGVIHIDHNIPMASLESGPPKWGKHRVCPYPRVLRELLEPLRGEAASGDLVFRWGEESTLNYQRWRTAFEAACAVAGVAGVTLHGLRHTLNTILLQRGISDAVIRAALGWSDPKIQARYSHIKFGDERYRSPIIDSVVEAINGGNRASSLRTPNARRKPGRRGRLH